MGGVRTVRRGKYKGEGEFDRWGEGGGENIRVMGKEEMGDREYGRQRREESRGVGMHQ